MSVTQVSVFLESRPGHLARILQDFRDADVNLRGYCVADTGDYGIARFIVDDAERACSVLADSGCATATGEVVCIRMTDEPGALAKVMALIAACDINISYSYSLIDTFVALKTDDIARAEALLNERGVDVVDGSALIDPMSEGN